MALYNLVVLIAKITGLAFGVAFYLVIVFAVAGLAVVGFVSPFVRR